MFERGGEIRVINWQLSQGNQHEPVFGNFNYGNIKNYAAFHPGNASKLQQEEVFERLRLRFCVMGNDL